MASVPEYCQVLRILDSKGEVKKMLFPKALDLYRPKRPRTTFTSEQLTEIEREFLRNPYLIGDERAKLAEKLNLSDTQIKVWFQNRRTKDRKRSCMSAVVDPYSEQLAVTKNSRIEGIMLPEFSLLSAALWSGNRDNFLMQPVMEFSHSCTLKMLSSKMDDSFCAATSHPTQSRHL